jgi:tetratricopeptide (TPR) repeat protein
MAQKKTLIIFFISWWLISCQSPTPKQFSPSDFLEDQTTVGELESGSSVPEVLWSPEQRRLMASYYFLVGESTAMAGNSAVSVKAFRNAYNLDPNPYIGGKVIEGEIRQGSESVLLDAERMTLLYPQSADLHFQLGQARLKARQVNLAIESFERCLSLDPNNEKAYVVLIQIYQAMNEPQRAMVVAKALIEQNPASMLGRVLLAKLNLMSGSHGEARRIIERAYDMHPSHPEVILIYALSLELTGDSSKAVSLYEQLYRLNPTNDELIGRMLQLYREIGNLDQALSILDDMLSGAGAERPGVLFQKAIILWELNRFDEAEIILDSLHSKFPQSDRVVYLLGLGKERNKKFDEALELYASIEKESSLFPASELRRAVVLRSLERWSEAITIVEPLLKAGNAEWEVYALAADLYAQEKQYLRSVQILQESTKRHPEQKSKAWFMVGVYFERAGERERCIEAMRQVLAVEPNNAAALNYLGYLFAEAGENLNEAKELIEKAVRLKPEDGYYLDSLGWVYFKLGQFQKALELLEKADKLAPNEGVILEHLGEVHLKLGNNKKAKDHFQRALKANLEERDRERIEARAKYVNSLD